MFRVKPSTKENLKKDKGDEQKAQASYSQREKQLAGTPAAPVVKEIKEDEQDHEGKLNGILANAKTPDEATEAGESADLDDADATLESSPMGEVPSPMSSGGLRSKLSMFTSGYLGPENGPFECEHCIHFQQPNACEIVDGEIDPEGCCNLFDPSDEPHDEDEEPTSEEEPQEAEGAESGEAPSYPQS